MKAEPWSLVFQDTAGEPLYKLFKALKHQVEKGPVDAQVKKAKYTLNDTGLLGDDVEYSVLVRPRPRRLSTGASRSKGDCVLSDPAGAGARRGPGRDPGQGAEL